jgi:D-alanyl-D-alanine carboxypeptidase (penicillin-binding protein 5/6)
MGVDNSNVRFEESGKLLNYGFGMYQGLKVTEANEKIKDINIYNGKEETARAIVSEDTTVPVRRGREKEINRVVEIDQRIKAPLKKGDKIGQIKIYKGNLLLKSVDIVIDRDVEKASFFQMTFRVMRGMVNSIHSLFS